MALVRGLEVNYISLHSLTCALSDQRLETPSVWLCPQLAIKFHEHEDRIGRNANEVKSSYEFVKGKSFPTDRHTPPHIRFMIGVTACIICMYSIYCQGY